MNCNKMHFLDKNVALFEGKSLTCMLCLKGNMSSEGSRTSKRLKIDETDAIILSSLLKESRTSFTELAKKCNISVGAVRMRYKRMWKVGIINGEIMQVNPHSLGYRCICDLGIITATENESEVKEFLTSKPYLSRVRQAFGKYNFATTVALTSIQKLSHIQEDLQANPLIKNVDALIWAETVNMDHTGNLIIGSFSGENQQKAEQSPDASSYKKTRIDEINRQIAKTLSQNSRTPFKKIAEQLGISTKSVIQRYRKLRGNVLTLSAITVDLKKLGYNATAGVFIRVANKSKIPEIYSLLLQIPNMIVTIRYLGPYDLFAIVALEDFEDLFKLQKQIHSLHNLEKVAIFLSPPFRAWPLNLFTSLL